VWTVRTVSQQLVGTDQKVCVQFDQHTKPLGLNKTNLKLIAANYGLEAQHWIGRPLELYRDQTQFQGRSVPCIRVRIPTHQPPAQATQHAFVPTQQQVPAQPAAVGPQQMPVQASPGAPPWV
jgi:hypothetical protein